MKSRVQNKQLIDSVVKQMMISFAMTLLDKHGFTHSEAVQALKDVDYTFDSISKGYLDSADLEKTLDEEYNIQFK